MNIAWEHEQLVRATKIAKQRMGCGWDKIGSEYRALLIKAEVLSILAAAASIENTPQGRLALLAIQDD